MKTILVPYDYSTMSDAAANAAADIAAAMKGRVILFYAHKTEHMRPEFQSGEVTYEEMKTEEKKLASVASRLKSGRDGLNVDCKVEQAFEKPVDAILDLATRTEASLIAMGTHGRSGLMHLALGSVAESVIRRAKCPVLVTKADA